MKELNVRRIHCVFLNTKEPETKELLKNLKMNDEEIDDILEEQIPNVTNFAQFSILSMSFPTMKTFKTGKDMLQLTFIINKTELIIITNEDHEELSKAFSELRDNFELNTPSKMLAFIVDNVREDSIDLIESSESYIDKKEKEIITGKKDKRLLIKMHNLKEAFHYVRNVMRANIETVREIMLSVSPYINNKQFNEHQGDRLNYLVSTSERLREAVSKNIELIVNLMTYKVDERVYKLTIVGSLLFIPTIFSGLFGMNVTLPQIGFWEIVIISGILSIITYFLIK